MFSVFASFSIFSLISISWSFINLFRIKARFINFSVVRISYFCVLLTFVHHICSAHNFLKLSLLRAYITVHNFDVICLAETYLDSSILHDDDNLQIPGYNLYRKDHPLNIK